MKTEKEINELIEDIKADKPIFNEETSIKGSLIVVLKWVLQTTSPKRMISNLTKEELKELLNIATNDKINSNILGEIYNNDFAIDYMYAEHNQYISQDIQFRIYKNHDFVLISNGITETIRNQVKLRNRLNEMLNGVEK